MKFFLKIIVLVVVVLSSIDSYAQSRKVGNANVIYSENLKSTSASTRFYLLGKKGDITVENDKNASPKLHISNDVLIMQVSYDSPGNTLPPFIYFWLTAYTKNKSKFKDNQQLTIHLDNEHSLIINTVIEGTKGGAELFSMEMKFTDFSKLAKAKQVTLQFGETRIELNSEQIAAFQDLYKTTEELSPIRHLQCLFP